MTRKVLILTRLLRVPSFRISYTIAVAAPLALLAWAFVDSWFWYTVRTVWGLTGIGQPRLGENTFAAGWHIFGPRLLILPSLVTVAALTSVIVFVRLFVGTKRDRSLLSWMLVILLIGVWSGVLLGVVRYPETQICYRLRRDLWRYKIVADVITAAGRIPASAKTEIGEIGGHSDADRFPAAFFPHDRRSIHEDIQKIWTLEEGALLFTIFPSRVALEFHPRGTRPAERFSTIKHGFDGLIVVPFEELGEGWFLVRRHQP
jgi:hypothetical protein